MTIEKENAKQFLRKVFDNEQIIVHCVGGKNVYMFFLSDPYIYPLKNDPDGYNSMKKMLLMLGIESDSSDVYLGLDSDNMLRFLNEIGGFSNTRKVEKIKIGIMLDKEEITLEAFFEKMKALKNKETI